MRHASSFGLAWALAFALLTAAHAPLLTLPYFWDELGQFIPASLDILQTGDWIPRMTTPNVHPPAVMAYLALVWRIIGYSIPAARLAMLAIAAIGVVATFALAKRLGASGWWSAGLLCVTPLFFTQAMMAQLDMPAMALTAVALVLFLDRRIAWCAAVCTLLVLAKETSVVAPVVFGGWLLWTGNRREAAWFLVPCIALGVWLAVLHSATGNFLGDTQFAQYNIGYALHPVRLTFAILRRLFYVFVADFRWIGTLSLMLTARTIRNLKAWLAARPDWSVCLIFAVLQALAVTVLGGAALERYLLPVFPILCVAFASTSVSWRNRTALACGLVISLWWPPPYPFPFENNLAVVDFVRLQQDAASYLESNAPQTKVASAWPFTDAVRRPEFGYVNRPHQVLASKDFGAKEFNTGDAGAVVVYTRVWQGPLLPLLKPWMRRFYEYDDPVTESDLTRLGFRVAKRFARGGQSAEVYLNAPRGL
ncbi:MAG: hypothetical protein ABI823_16690 [Bryobacteraceae bacterium]